jgi:hypothetical protein
MTTGSISDGDGGLYARPEGERFRRAFSGSFRRVVMLHIAD